MSNKENFYLLSSWLDEDLDEYQHRTNFLFKTYEEADQFVLDKLYDSYDGLEDLDLSIVSETGEMVKTYGGDLSDYFLFYMITHIQFED